MWPMTKFAADCAAFTTLPAGWAVSVVMDQLPFSRSVFRMLDWSRSKEPPKVKVCLPCVHVASSRMSAVLRMNFASVVSDGEVIASAEIADASLGLWKLEVGGSEVGHLWNLATLPAVRSFPNHVYDGIVHQIGANN